MGAVHTLGLAQFIQSEAVNYHICHFCKLQSFFFQHGILFTVSLVSAIDADDRNIIVFAYIRQHFQLCGIDHRGSGALISRFHGKVTNEGNFCSFL